MELRLTHQEDWTSDLLKSEGKYLFEVWKGQQKLEFYQIYGSTIHYLDKKRFYRKL